MKEVLEKISTYKIFNHLLPGILFVVLTRHLTGYNFITEDNIINAFLYYFIGLVISRLGSLFIEPLMEKMKMLKLAKYEDFIAASKKDDFIEILLEIGNTYRTIIAALCLLLVLKTFHFFDVRWPINKGVVSIIIVVLTLIIFVMSYRKQTMFIYKRVENANNN